MSLTNADMSNDTVLRSAQIPNIVGIQGRDWQHRAWQRGFTSRYLYFSTIVIITEADKICPSIISLTKMELLG